jgi:hypothetical protein
MRVSDKFEYFLKAFCFDSFIVSKTGIEVVGIAIEDVLEIEYFEVEEGSGHDDCKKVVDLCLLVVKT